MSILSRTIASFSLLISCTFLMSCREIDLATQKIHDIQFVVPQEVLDNGVLPAQMYPLRINVVVEKDDGTLQTIETPDEGMLAISTSARISYSNGYIAIETTNVDSWKTGYTLQVSVLNNPFPAKSISFRTHWSAFTSVSYAGSKGSNGASGRPGHDGRNGPSLIISSTRVRAEDRNWRLVKVEREFVAEPDWLMIPEVNPFEFHTTGGRGGRGGDGSDGESRSNCESEQVSLTTARNRADGKAGGDGGDGGDGGNISYAYHSEQNQLGLSFYSLGGEGGRGGIGGTGGRYCGVSGSNGRNGSPGHDGHGGLVTVERPGAASIRAKFSELDLTGIEFID